MKRKEAVSRSENRFFFIAFHFSRRFFKHAAINREDWRLNSPARKRNKPGKQTCDRLRELSKQSPPPPSLSLSRCNVESKNSRVIASKFLHQTYNFQVHRSNRALLITCPGSGSRFPERGIRSTSLT